MKYEEPTRFYTVVVSVGRGEAFAQVFFNSACVAGGSSFTSVSNAVSEAFDKLEAGGGDSDENSDS